jgi:hypothetical protein
LQTGSGRISEADFVRFLLKGAKITPKKKASLIKKVDSLWPPSAKGRGVSFPSFKVNNQLKTEGIDPECLQKS